MNFRLSALPLFLLTLSGCGYELARDPLPKPKPEPSQNALTRAARMVCTATNSDEIPREFPYPVNYVSSTFESLGRTFKIHLSRTEIGVAVTLYWRESTEEEYQTFPTEFYRYGEEISIHYAYAVKANETGILKTDPWDIRCSTDEVATH